MKNVFLFILGFSLSATIASAESMKTIEHKEIFLRAPSKSANAAQTAELTEQPRTKPTSTEMKEIFECYEGLQELASPLHPAGPRSGAIDQFAIVPASSLSVSEDSISGNIIRLHRKKDASSKNPTELSLTYDTFKTDVPKGTTATELNQARSQNLANSILRSLGHNFGKKVKMRDQVVDDAQQRDHFNMLKNWLVNDIFGSNHFEKARAICPESVIKEAQEIKADSTMSANYSSKPTRLEQFFKIK